MNLPILINVNMIDGTTQSCVIKDANLLSDVKFIALKISDNTEIVVVTSGNSYTQIVK
jgi:hypothetical protein